MSLTMSHRPRGEVDLDRVPLRELRPILALLDEVSRACAAMATPEEAISACLEMVARFTEWPIAHAYRRRESDGAFESMGIWHIASSVDQRAAQAFICVSQRLVFTIGMGLVGEVAAEGRPVTCEDVLPHPGFTRAAAARASGVRGCFAFPVLVEGRAEIVIEAFAHEIAELDGDLMQLMTFVAERLAAMIVERRRRVHILDAALGHMSHGLVMVDGHDRVVLVNPKYLEFYGLCAATVRPGVPMREVIERSAAVGNHPGLSADEVWHVRQSMIAAGVAGYRRQVLPSGRVIDVHMSPLGEGQGWVTIHNDVTQQAKAEAVLGHQHRLFDTALSNMTQGLLMLDADLRLIVCNDRFQTLVDIPPEVARPGAHISEIMGYDLARRIPGRTLDGMMAERRALFERNEPLTLQSVFSNGRIVEVVYNPMAGGGWVATYSDVTARREAEARLAHIARHDALTDLPNRVLFRERLVQALADMGKAEPPATAVLCLDLDRFKSVNDALGHATGDALLREVAGRLCAVVGETGTVARWGGDGFALVLPRVRPEQASSMAKDLVDEVGRDYDIAGQRVNIGLSVGVALAPTDGQDPEQLVRAADMALDRAKDEGRGTFCFFEPGMDACMQARRELERDLRQALAAGQFELHYQPLVALDRDRISAFEALVRWHHPSRGLVSPAEFIPLAEEIGLIVPLGEWVLMEACREAASWPGRVRVAVNLSPVQFRSAALVPSIAAALGHSGLDPRRLELEITEGVLLQDGESTLSILHRIKDLGVRIAMDDFGTGYSSLSYLQRFPFDKIKIDRSFIADIASRASAVAIVRAVTSLGASLGIATTAEGIETQEQLERLRAEGCAEVQGYLISRPVPAHKVAAMLTYDRSKVRAGTANRAVQPHPHSKVCTVPHRRPAVVDRFSSAAPQSRLRSRDKRDVGNLAGGMDDASTPAQEGPCTPFSVRVQQPSRVKAPTGIRSACPIGDVAVQVAPHSE